MAVSGEQLSELMSAYLDGEASDREKSVVEEALRNDPAARQLLDELRKTVAVVGSLPRHSAPPDLALALDARLERAQLLEGFREDLEPASAPTSWRNYFRAAAMLGFVLVAGWWFLATQQRTPSPLAMSTTRSESKPRDTKSVPAENTASKSDKVEAETLLANGADPVTLVNHSFAVEPVRIRVTARNAAERDALTRKFAEQLAQAHAENLAGRKGDAKDKQTVGSFYLEGKPGVNFQNVQEKQILVRIPQIQAEQLIDKVVAGAKIPSDQFALQVGPATVRGQDAARLMLQGVAGNAPAGSNDTTLADRVTPTPGTGAMSTGLLRTLEGIVGIQPAHSGSPPTSEHSRVADAASGSLHEPSTLKKELDSPSASTKSSALAERPEDAPSRAKTSTDSSKPDSDTLVARKYDAALSRGADRERGASSEITAAAPGGRVDQNSFITIVVEFVLPETQPARRETGRLRS